MSDETLDTTGEMESVATSTAPVTPVSSESRRSDPDVRIANLQSILDRTKNELAKMKADKEEALRREAQAVKERLDTKLAHEGLVTRVDDVVNEASRATQEALNIAKAKEEENATLKAKQSKLQFVLDNQDMVGYAAILPDTVDTNALQEAAKVIRAQRDKERSAITDQMKVVSNMPSASPSVMTGSPIADPGRYLDGAMNNAELFEKRLAELIAQTSTPE